MLFIIATGRDINSTANLGLPQSLGKTSAIAANEPPPQHGESGGGVNVSGWWQMGVRADEIPDDLKGTSLEFGEAVAEVDAFLLRQLGGGVSPITASAALSAFVASKTSATRGT